MLLDLTTHPGTASKQSHFHPISQSFSDKTPTRTAAINTVRRWVPDTQPMDRMIRDFALQLLRRLQTRSSGMDEEDGQLPQDALVQTPYLGPTVTLPARKSEILQHVELLFALSVKAPDLLEECNFHCAFETSY
jgi:symplekin